MSSYTCALAGGYKEVSEDIRPDNAAKGFVERVWFSEVVPRADEYRVTVTDERGNRWTYDVHVEGIELELSVMPVDGKK